jgi:hypothetical protein
MKKFIIPYLLILSLIIVIAAVLILSKKINLNLILLETASYCFLFGSIGGIVQCFRGYYLHTALFKDWDDDWNVWYYLRPIVSGILGFISLVFIKAGLFVFSSEGGSNLMAYLAIAFIAGYNVQNFLNKLEEVSKTTLGIHKKDKPN